MHAINAFTILVSKHAAAIATAARQADWTRKSHFTFITSDGTVVDLTLDDQEWSPVVREGLCLAMWRNTAPRRVDMHSIEQGIDKDATLALLSGHRLSTWSKGTLRSMR